MLIKKIEEEYGKPISEFNVYDWTYISRYQNLSEDFIREFQHKIKWDYLLKNQKLSKRKEKIKWYQFWK